MFTGIVRKIEKIIGIKTENQSLFIIISLPIDWLIKEGESISINGICSTVRNVGRNNFEVEYMPETLSKTTASNWRADDAVNLERSLKLGDSIDGHLVSGHIDTIGKIINIEQKGDSKIFTIKIAKEFVKYLAPKGSVALDGVSLTVVDALRDSFTVSLVSYTLSHTNFSSKKVGDLINIETDTIAKYVINFTAKQ